MKLILSLLATSSVTVIAQSEVFRTGFNMFANGCASTSPAPRSIDSRGGLDEACYSSDGGVTWQALSNGDTVDFILYCGTTSGTGWSTSGTDLGLPSNTGTVDFTNGFIHTNGNYGYGTITTTNVLNAASCGSVNDQLTVVRTYTIKQDGFGATMSMRVSNTGTGTGTGTIRHVRGWLSNNDNYIQGLDGTGIEQTTGYMISGDRDFQASTSAPGNAIRVRATQAPGDMYYLFGSSGTIAVQRSSTGGIVNQNPATAPLSVLDTDASYGLFYDFGDLATGTGTNSYGMFSYTHLPYPALQPPPPSPPCAHVPRFNLPNCDCDNFRNQLTTEHKCEHACARFEPHGQSGVKKWCEKPSRPYVPFMDNGCPSDLVRCIVTYERPMFQRCTCSSFAGEATANSNDWCQKMSTNECYPLKTFVQENIGGSEFYGCGEDMFRCHR